ncbi:LacI family DNA-binding transcriptional regulator [Streptomyces sp. ICBB 8177]|uniref:LacI family DNA-binding transcriptional regulator n=1 Tax=Streptomyces sp. ICBB 8177 TaxID=563922 RepID=UPI000D67F28C|nr:LacI family DNA-binding transcriptional regulator [Streptomyces sp. ICBB 8177]PWI45432.1 LacI family transcriptional regulator [Streptomyces sp. ICBB 8177]
MTTTLADVAARAGVSSATVSRVLNGNYPVADHTRERVLRAVEDLEYVVNGNARALAAATSDLVGVLVNDVADPFFGILASAAQAEISRGGDVGRQGQAGAPGGGKLAVVCNTGGSPEAELTYLTLLRRQRAAGVILTGSAVEGADTGAIADRLARLAASGTRVVLCGRPPLPSATSGTSGTSGPSEPAGSAGPSRPSEPSEERAEEPEGGSSVMTLGFDNRGGSELLTRHLIRLGHRRIGCVAGPVDRTTTRHRLEGHRNALRAYGLERECGGLTAYGHYDRASGHRAALELLDRRPDLTAIVAANDTVALGVIAALRERGLRVPQDVSVTGFDDLPFSVDATPALTTVRLPLHEAGARAGRLVMGRETAPPGAVTLVEGELVVRESTAPPRES